MCLILLIAHLISIFFSFLLNLIVWLCCEWQCSVQRGRGGISPPLSASGGAMQYGPGQRNISESLERVSEEPPFHFISVSFPFLRAWNENVLAKLPALLWTWRWGPHLKEGGTEIYKGAWVSSDIIEHPYRSSWQATSGLPITSEKTNLYLIKPLFFRFSATFSQIQILTTTYNRCAFGNII